MVEAKYLRLPDVNARFVAVWRRNFLVWKKLAISSILGNIADPLLYMLALGFGLGSLLPQVDGTRYIVFLAGGTVCYSAMNSATFEVLYSAFSRMHVQRTWDAIINAPVSLDDVLMGEWIWAASKSFLSGMAILLVIWILGLSHSPMTLWIVPIAWLIGLCFAGMGLVMTSIAPSYDFFMYYFSLLITPMTLLCGVFFPLAQLPPVLQAVAQFLPLTHAIELVRPLLNGAAPNQVLLHVAVLAVYGAISFYIAVVLTRRRLLK
jgi:lipooligosaccharide transport system permease protein